MVGMTGLLNAQMNLEMASKVQQAGNTMMSSGRILEREGVMSKNEDAIEAGLLLQAEGEEKKNSSMSHLEKAMEELKASADERKEEAKAKAEEDAKAKLDEKRAEKAENKDAEVTAQTEASTQTVFDGEDIVMPAVKSPVGNKLDVVT